MIWLYHIAWEDSVEPESITCLTPSICFKVIKQQAFQTQSYDILKKVMKAFGSLSLAVSVSSKRFRGLKS